MCALTVIPRSILNASPDNMQHLEDIFGSGRIIVILIDRGLLWPENKYSPPVLYIDDYSFHKIGYQ